MRAMCRPAARALGCPFAWQGIMSRTAHYSKSFEVPAHLKGDWASGKPTEDFLYQYYKPTEGLRRPSGPRGAGGFGNGCGSTPPNDAWKVQRSDLGGRATDPPVKEPCIEVRSWREPKQMLRKRWDHGGPIPGLVAIPRALMCHRRAICGTRNPHWVAQSAG